MLTYLQGNTRLEISVATHQLAQFCQDPKLSHEQATTHLGWYLAHTKDRGIVNEPDNIRSAKQDDIYGASNIVLPCPGC